MSWRTLLLGLLAFLLALLVVFPASWGSGLLPANVHCAQWRGTLWSGHCAQLNVKVPGEPLVMIESVGWTLHPLSLLRGRVVAQVVLTDARGDATGYVEYGHNGLLMLHDVSARTLLDPQFSIGLPAGWRGRMEVQQLDFQMQAEQLQRLQGELRFLDLVDEQGHDMGNYHVVFPLASTPPFNGQLNDAGGPLELHATLGLTADRSWTLNGTVAIRSGDGALFRRYLEALGAPDSSGRYPLSATGTFR